MVERENPGSFSFLAGGGEMGALIRSMDWSQTPLGPPESWPQSLRTTLNLCLASNFPLCFIWGPDRVQIYNDGYWPICAAKHPHSMGQDYKECWFSAWPVIGPGFERCVATGETTFLTDTRMFLDRNGYLEETFFTFSFSPIRDETGNIAGVFHPVTETTHLVLAERRLGVLRALADRTADVKTVDEALALAAEALAEHPLDLPFVLLYRLDAKGLSVCLAGAAGLSAGCPMSPDRIDLQASQSSAWPLSEVIGSGRVAVVEELEERFGAYECGAYPESSQTAMLFPITLAGGERPTAVLIAGVSPRRALDDAYRGFYDMLVTAVTAALSNAHSVEQEKRRAEALAELDLAKTAFFSNVSHEFRTPLTLMLGPLEELLQRPDNAPPSEEQQRLALVHRNGLRLLKLVNALLDFSRIEAGRAQATYAPVDLAALTADLAGLFRSAIERAGLQLQVDCPPLPEPVYVDREMWEKIVLNLLSNAFKFTFEGRIDVAMRHLGEQVELEVRDTGSGIPDNELPHVFERFHRVKGAVGRSYEGSGIGLSLVQELVRLHGGTIQAESRTGRGTAFRIQVPTGAAHLPADRINAPRQLASTAVRAEAFVEEALRWLPEGGGTAPSGAAASTAGCPTSVLRSALDAQPGELPGAESAPARVLLADDNADMREYLCHLLSGVYEVTAVADGQAALAAVRERPPDLVLSDVMMPLLDGFGLLGELRADPRTSTIPVILLSARAGEEARVEGLAAGADDYLVKPFTARELLARVEASLKLSHLRQEVEHAAGREEALREADRRKDEFLAMLAHELRNPLAPIRTALEIVRRRSDPATLQRMWAMMERQTVHLSRLIDDLLDVSRITTGKITLQRERLDLGRLLPTIVDDHRPEAETAGIALRLGVPEPPVWVSADPVRLTQIIGNLLENARKFTDPGGEVLIRLMADPATNAAVLTVQDTGTGIEPEMLGRLFQSFSQADRSLDRSRGGLGLGLALVKGLVELHDGSVAAESQGLGHGATFTLRLPVLPELPALSELPVAGKWPPKHLRILVVEDNPDAAESLRMLLELAGSEVTVARTGPTGVEAARSGQPDVVLCDIGLPGMDGFAVAMALRADATTARTRLIAVTGYGADEDVQRAHRAGFDEHLTKPVNPTTLLQRLDAPLVG